MATAKTDVMICFDPETDLLIRRAVDALERHAPAADRATAARVLNEHWMARTPDGYAEVTLTAAAQAAILERLYDR